MRYEPEEYTARPEGFRDGEGEFAGDGFGAGTERPLKELVREFMDEGRRLVRAELTLARAELRAEAKKAGAGAGLGAAGGVVALLGGMTLVAFLVLALAQVMPAWASALLVAVVLLAVGGGLVMAAKKRLTTVHGPTKTIQTLKEDKEWARRTMQSVKSATHGNA